MAPLLDVAIIGAGPYGLSLAAHLRQTGVRFRIFGRAMHHWAAYRPPGMFLKSDGSSSSLSEPDGSFTIGRFHRERGLAYETQAPIANDTFIDYGRDFQKRFVPTLEEVDVVAVEKQGDGYSLRLSDGEILRAAKVVVAIGIQPFRHIPEIFAALPETAVSHSSDYGPVAALAGKTVAVIGSGASAIDMAAALHEGGANAIIVSRRTRIPFNSAPQPRKLRHRIRRPDSGIGAGWMIKFCADAPHLVRYLPRSLRVHIVRNYLGPAPGWFMRKRVEGVVPFIAEATPQAVTAEDGKIRLTLAHGDGRTTELAADHVIAGTGFRVDIAKLDFLSPALLKGIDTIEKAPVLSPRFESSVAGLYFIGPVAAMSFGPVMRFVYGADFTTRRLSRHLAKAATGRQAVIPVLARG